MLKSCTICVCVCVYIYIAFFNSASKNFPWIHFSMFKKYNSLFICMKTSILIVPICLKISVQETKTDINS
jgi:hypothetical protein